MSRAGLTKKTITNKNGKRTSVWVRTGTKAKASVLDLTISQSKTKADKIHNDYTKLLKVERDKLWMAGNHHSHNDIMWLSKISAQNLKKHNVTTGEYRVLTFRGGKNPPESKDIRHPDRRAQDEAEEQKAFKKWLKEDNHNLRKSSY